ncbi:hypothetical protein BJ322DRAFT_136413 [Thelephora terrestris]|uniref:NACHT domain-containing protein n=1 Tax=Thelephora terrestris TaxID=56493 RepID=A0A9P6L4M2_9AGAM|nr:hypothetical protein BJ322DRAFT_136413 [Thelephora terrestris]
MAFVRARLDRFGNKGKTSRNADELRRQKNLYESLEGIKDQLDLLSKQADEGADEGINMTAVSDLAEDLRDIILDYHFSQQKAIYNQNCTLIEAADSLVLNNCRQAQAAEFLHGDRRGCLKGTREAVLDEIESWSKDYSLSPVYWLNGLAGTGKSTIAQTIAERLFADGRLGASFFCSRDFEDRRDLRYIFPTLAIQLAHSHPEFRSILVALIRSKPSIVHESLCNQMESLIVRPLSTLNVSTVIIIDALDECADEEPQSAILSVMGRLVEGIPTIKFLITGRPEPRIKSGFRLGLLRPLTDVFVLHEVDPSVVNADIRLFLEQGLHKIAKRQSIDQDGWPTDGYLDLLCERAGGLFVYAAATLKFLDHSFALASEQLDVIIRAPGSTTHEGQAQLRLGATLDSLYLSSFKTAFRRTTAGDDEKVRLVIGAVVLAVNPLPPSAIATLVNLGQRQVMNLLQLVQSLLKLSEDPDFPVLPFHKSFPDFITDPLRCSDNRFHIPPRTGHLKLATNCLRLMNSRLRQNLLSLPDYALNSEVGNLKGRIDDVVGNALYYACRSWHYHLTEVKEDFAAIVPPLRNFLQERFLGWLEVLSVGGSVNDAVIALERLILWLQEVAKDHQLLLTARDYFQFVTNFFEVIDASATHLYHSALELSPLTSMVRKLYYHQRPHPSPRVVFGIQDSWNPPTAIPNNDSYLSSAWSPCGKFIAVMAKKVAEIWDALTLKPLSTLQLVKEISRYMPELAYSPDGYSLAGCSDSAIIIWDTQTGGEITRIDCQITSGGLEIVWSEDGDTIATISPWKSETSTVCTYSISSGAKLSLAILRSSDKPYLWAHKQSFQTIATTQGEKGKTFNVFKVGSTLTQVESFSSKCNFDLEAYSPPTYRALMIKHSSGASTICIIDIRSSEILLQEQTPGVYGTFSPDAGFFATFSCYEPHVSVWKLRVGHYVKWKEFQHKPASIQFSSTSSSILNTSTRTISVVHLDYLPTAFTVEHVKTTQGKIKDVCSPNGAYIATACQGESTVTITNLHSQNPCPSQYIDTGLEISKMVLTGNVLMVKGPDKIVAWLLTEEGPVNGIIGNPRADQNDSLWELSVPALVARFNRIWRHQIIDATTLGFLVAGETAIIRFNHMNVYAYHIGTGEAINLTSMSVSSNHAFYRFDNELGNDECDLYHDNLHAQKKSIESKWSISQATLKEGWVKDPEGKHMLWVPPNWRAIGGDVYWFHDTKSLQLKGHSQLAVIRF